MTLTAIDPGKKQLAWAHFSGSDLYSAGLSRFPKDAVTWDMNIAEYALYHAAQIPSADIVVLEGMFHYPKSATDSRDEKTRSAIANDLLELQAIGGITAGKVGETVRLVTASEWKGQVDKTVTRYRIDGVDFRGEKVGHGCLNPLELERLTAHLARIPRTLRHNVYDAVALGLTFLGRMKK